MKPRVTQTPKDFLFGMVRLRVKQTFIGGFVLKNRCWESIDEINGSFEAKGQQR